MQRIRFAEEQIIAVLREHEAGAKTADLARTHGVSEATLYNWNAKYGGVDVSEARRLRALGEENRKLKRLLAESMLDVAALKELLTRQMYGRASKIPVSRSVAAYANSRTFVDGETTALTRRGQSFWMNGPARSPAFRGAKLTAS